MDENKTMKELSTLLDEIQKVEDQAYALKEQFFQKVKDQGYNEDQWLRAHTLLLRACTNISRAKQEVKWIEL